VRLPAAYLEPDTTIASFPISATETLVAPQHLRMGADGRLWLVAVTYRNVLSGCCAVVDLNSQTSVSCHDFMDGYQYHGLCAHPSHPQVRPARTARITLQAGARPRCSPRCAWCACVCRSP
jgi:hypothetical protein